MKLDAEILKSLQALIPKHHGVFSLIELRALFLARSSVGLQRQLKPFLQAKILNRFCRGFYVAQNFDLEWLSQRLCSGSAISMGTILAKELVIGSIPQKTVYAVKKGKSRIYKSPLGQVVHFGFANAKDVKRLWVGYTLGSDGIRRADKEKAFLDTLYFYQLGNRFSFNIYSDIQVARLDHLKLNEYLTHYENPKFITFVEGVINGKHQVR